MYYEVKGWLNADALRKQRLMTEFYPDVMVITIGPEEYRELEKAWSGEVAWERPGQRQDDIEL